MSEDITRFLHLEQQATDLTMELERLREETLNSRRSLFSMLFGSNATKRLDEATIRLENTTTALQELIGKSREFIGG